jgi:ribosome-associated protein
MISAVEEDKPEKSKSLIKREMIALQALGGELVQLSDKSLNQLPLSQPVRVAIALAKKLKMQALRRQVKHIGKLLRDENIEAVQSALARLRNPEVQDVQSFHEVEAWRDGLLAEDAGVLEELAGRFPALDRQHVRQLVRNAAKEHAMNKPTRSARALFQYLKELSSPS